MARAFLLPRHRSRVAFARAPERMTDPMWDQRYGVPGYAYGTAPNDFLVDVAARIPPGRVLSLGEGEGRNAVFLAARGHAVVAVDQSAVGLAKARRLAAERGVHVETVCTDLDAFAIEPGAWAGIVSVFCHLPRSIRVPLHAAIVRGLQPGGVFVLEAYTPAQLGRGTGGPGVPELLPSLAELKVELQGLDFLHGVEREREIHEGNHHHGVGAVVQILARKPGG